jgi:alpha-glucosidase
MDISKISYVIRSIGLSGIARILINSVYRDILEKRYVQKNLRKTPIIPGSIQNVKPIVSGLRAEFIHANVEIQFLSTNLIRVSWEPGKQPIPYTIEKSDWVTKQPIIETQADNYSLSYGDITIIIGNNGELTFQDAQQLILRRDEPPICIDDCWKLSTYLKSEEHIYGLGERAAPLNLRPGSYCSWNTDIGGSYTTGVDPLYIGTPIYLSLSSTGGYLVYFENSYKSNYFINEKLTVSFEGGALRYYIIFGSLSTIYQQLGELIGRPYLPPRWSLGYHQCRWGYQNEKDILDVVNGFETHHLPISAIHLDIDYMDGFRVFTVDPNRFPDLKRLTQLLNDKDIKVVASINPAIKNDNNYKIFTDGILKDLYCKLPNGKPIGGVSWPGWSVFPDYSSKPTRDWWSEHYQYLLDAGISGFWHDMNEPSSFSAWGDITLPNSTQHYLEGDGGDHREFHNLYGLLMNKASFEGISNYMTDKRPWIFSRSGWASLQKYAWNWTGDIETSWKSLNQSISTILGLGLSGHAFSGVDIGGFTGDPDAELYLRWFQMATFFPLFRTHSAIGTKRREPWVFGENITNIIRNFLELRYKLMPYLYSLVWDATQTGVPPLKPLFWVNPEDASLRDIDDEFILGDALLIAPVVTQGAQTRRITLPPGFWYSYWDDSQYIGPSQFDYQVSLSTIPIFIKGGSILPMEGKNSLDLHVYPGYDISSSNHIYLDAGDGYGDWRLDTFHSNHQPKSIDISWDCKGEFPFPYAHVNLELHSLSLIQAIVDNNSIPIQANSIITHRFRNISLTIE